ncbi:MAG TPA: glycosyltransferase [Firmicutes bacterium]|nr:glycosyltransferase [Candidatus Fermentithermobacillaceae bacterium]
MEESKFAFRRIFAPVRESFGPHDILNLTADMGAGHRRASEALEGALREARPGTTILTLNYIRFVHPLLDIISSSIYVNTIKVAPELYRRFYRVTKEIEPDSLWQTLLNNLGHRRLLRLLQKVKPKVILATFPTPAGVVGELKRRGLVSAPLVTVVTDNAVHTQWVNPWTDLYIVASEKVLEGLTQRGIPAERIAVTGIPIDKKFSENIPRDVLYAKYHLDPSLPTVLVLGSAYGMTHDVPELCRSLAHTKRRLQLIVVCGHDKILRWRCLEAVERAKNPARVFGFVNTMHELMRVSDLAVTKAGGLTMSEALACGLPLVIHKPIPGQEEENSKFLVSSGAAVESRDAERTRDLVFHLLDHPDELDAMRQKAKTLGHPNSARDAAQEIIQRYLHK